MEKVVRLERIRHRDAEQVTIRFDADAEIEKVVRALPGRKWSQTLRSWYVPFEPGIIDKLYDRFKERVQVDCAPPAIKHKAPGLPDKNSETTLVVFPYEEQLGRFKHFMNSKRYSASTVGTYTEALRVFLRFTGNKALREIDSHDLIKFNNEYILKNRLSSSYQNQVVNAVKLFFSTVEDRKLELTQVHRPKRAKRLPNVMSKEEVRALLLMQDNVKHRAMLGLIYSCGLRCGELLSLRYEHLDRARGALFIRQAKGRKDRWVPLSRKTLEMLDEYLSRYKPSVFLFEGAKGGEPYDARSLQQVMKQSLAKAGNTRNATLHWLRHSYATHLMDAGTNLRYIQELLGHSSSRTTEIYTHVSNQGLESVRSPFDDLY